MLCRISLVLLLVSLPCVIDARENCQRHILDDCSKSLLMLGDETFVFPTTIEQMNKRCKEIKSLEKCVKDYSDRCLNGETRNSLNVVLYGIIKTNKGYCGGAKKKNAFISFGKCTNGRKKQLGKFMEKMNWDFHGARLAKDPKMRLPFACCNFYKFKSSVIKELEGDCPVEVQEVENLIDGYARDGLNFLCGDYTEDSDKCSKIIHKTPKWTKALTSKDFILALVDLLNSL